MEVIAYPVYLVLALVFYFRPPAPAEEAGAVLETKPTKAS